MRKKPHPPGNSSRLLAVILAVFFLIPTASALKNVTVGSSSGYNQFVPVCTTWHDTQSETVYPSDVLGNLPEGSTIRRLGYSGISSVNVSDMDYEVYLKNTSQTSAPADKSDLSDFTRVYSGKISVSESEDKTTPETLLDIELQEEFVYQGDNLHVVVISHVADLPGGGINFSYQSLPKTTLLTLSNNDWESYNKYSYNYLPVMQLGIDLPAGYEEFESVTVGTHGAYAEYERLPLDFSETHTVSESIYTQEMLGIDAGMQIRRISFFGSVYTTSDLPHHVRVWLDNTSDTEPAREAPDVTFMTKVADKDILLDKKAGSLSNWAEILKIDFDSPFRYDGKNLRVIIEVTNEASQYVYFCQNPSYKGSTVYGSGTAPDLEGLTYFSGALPTTNFYYAPRVMTQEPEITLVTDLTPGQKLGMLLLSTEGVSIDWGGYFTDYPFGGYLSVTHDLYGQEVKIYPMDPLDHIEMLTCSNGALNSVTLNAPGLKNLQLRDNNLTTIDLSGAPQLELLDLHGNSIFEFASTSETLKTLRLSKCGLEQLIITDCTSLEYLDVSINALRYPTWIFMPEAPNLNYLNVSFNSLLSLDLSEYTQLRTLICNHNNLSYIDLQKAPLLETLRAGYNGISTLNLSKCPSLKVLDICGTSAGGVNLSANPALEELNLSLTGISKVNLADNTALKHLDVSRNSLSDLDLSANKALTHLDVSHNAIAGLKLNALKKLAFLDCSSNALTELDITGNNALDTLYCSVNRLQELPLPKGNHISRLDFASNEISAQPGNMEAVVYLNCADNKWTSTDFTKTPSILGIDIHSNMLGKEALSAMFRQLPDINGTDVPENDTGWMTVLNYNDNPGASEVNPEIAETKGWNCSYRPDILGDASAAIVIPSDKVYTRISFGIDTPEAVYYVDWGDGKKTEYKPENPDYTYNSIVGFATGDVIRIYAPEAIELGICNVGYLDVDVSGMPLLRRLSCSGNQFTSLDVSSNPELVDLNCRENPISSLVLPDVCKLNSLDCSSTLLRSIDLAPMPELTYLAINSCRLENLDLSPVRNLVELRADNNSLKSIDLSAAPALRNVYISANELTALDVTGNHELTNLAADYNSIGSLDLRGLDFLETAHVNNNRLTSLLLDNLSMKVLLASANMLEEVDLRSLKSATVISLYDNNLSSLDFSANTALQQIFAGENRLTEVKLPAYMDRLRVLNLTNNRLSSLDFKAMPGMTELVISGNQFGGTLDLSANSAITYLDVAHNEIESFRWGSSSSLATLYASYNNLSTLNVPSDDLSVIDCSRNQLEAVNLSRATNLFYLVLDFNNLSTINLGSNSKLWGVSLRANDLGTDAINKIVEQLPDVTDVAVIAGEEYWMKILFLSGNPGVADANTRPARLKGWTVVTNEEIPVDRILSLTVTDESGAPVDRATLTLIVNGEDVGTRAVETAAGVYVYDPLPVFSGLTYAVRIEKQGFVSQTVDINAVISGDLSMTVVLARASGVDETAEDQITVTGGNGTITVTLAETADISVFDLSGRLIYQALLPEGRHIIDGLHPGIYIAGRRKVVVK